MTTPTEVRQHIDILIDMGIIELRAPNDRGVTQFAKMMGVGRRTARRWLSGDVALKGAHDVKYRERIDKILLDNVRLK
jgi:DNA-binding transcriptional regulator YiaG